jgi:hypothetical protein
MRSLAGRLPPGMLPKGYDDDGNGFRQLG